ncbi:sensor domain-containing protein [Mycobacterium spongiae]|nr:sensor domain-containing protein [Mycobacterium spongiae]
MPTTTAAPDVDSLIVSVEDARRIASFEDLTPDAHADTRKPSRGDPNAPGPCRAASNSDLTFGSRWTAFRRVGYIAATDALAPGEGVSMVAEVSQAVAMYANSDTARQVLDRLESSLRACAALRDPDYDFTLERPDDSTLKLSAADWSHLYREKSSVLISVGVVGLERTDQIANNVLQTVTDRIN